MNLPWGLSAGNGREDGDLVVRGKRKGRALITIDVVTVDVDNEVGPQAVRIIEDLL
jgi:hypothetical protein